MVRKRIKKYDPFKRAREEAKEPKVTKIPVKEPVKELKPEPKRSPYRPMQAPPTPSNFTKEEMTAYKIGLGGDVKGTGTITPRVEAALADVKVYGSRKKIEEELMEEKSRAEITEELRPQIFPEEAAAEAEAKELLMEEKPERRSLAPEPILGEKIPVLGGMISTITNLAGIAVDKGWLPKKGYYGIMGRNIDPEILRNDALTQIEKNVYDEGITASESFGAVIEGIPVVGGLVSKYVHGLVETPSGNVNTLVRQIRIEKGRATKTAEQARMGLIPPELASDMITDIELGLQRIESRIKYLVNFSPELRFNSDEVNRLEEEVLRAREYLLDAKARALLGGGAPPSDAAIFGELGEENE